MKTLKSYKSNNVHLDNDILMMATYISKRMRSSKEYKRSLSKTNKSKFNNKGKNRNKSGLLNN